MAILKSNTEADLIVEDVKVFSGQESVNDTTEEVAQELEKMPSITAMVTSSETLEDALKLKRSSSDERVNFRKLNLGSNRLEKGELNEVAKDRKLKLTRETQFVAKEGKRANKENIKEISNEGLSKNPSGTTVNTMGSNDQVDVRKLG
ncbi:2491_t:CDS:2, partial [Dentiscutata heterogama]